MRILVVGVGATGGYFGGRLLATQRDVTFLVRPHRGAELAKHGLEIQSCHGDLHFKAPPTVVSEEIRAPFDLILLSCKAQDLAGAINSFAPAVGTATAILPLLNGMRHLDTLDGRFGRDRVLGGTCFISAVRDAKGRIVHLGDVHRLSFGERDGLRTQRIEQINPVLLNAGFEAHRSETILQDMWDKWVFIATAAGMTCLMRASIGDIVAADAAYLTLRFLDECAAIATHEGFPPTPASIERNRAIFTAPGSAQTTSMLRDLENHAPLEAGQIIGDLLRRGNEHRLATPLLDIAYAHMKAYEARRNREGVDEGKAA
jgi:2-dehydropantoate 2-reductase